MAALEAAILVSRGVAEKIALRVSASPRATFLWMAGSSPAMTKR